MQTCIVAVSGLEYCDNYRHLPLSFVEEIEGQSVRFMLHSDPQRELVSNTWRSNYDLLLDLNYTSIHTEADFRSPRLSKHEQVAKLSQWAKESEATAFIPIPVYSKREEVTNIYDLTEMPQFVLLKSVDGARGVAHLVFDTIQGNLFKFIRDLKTTVENVPVTLDKYKASIELHRGECHNDQEIHTVLHEHPLMVLGLITDIQTELRVLLNHESKPVLVKSRTRNDNIGSSYTNRSGYRQATGAHRSLTAEAATITDAFKHGWYDEIERFLKLMPPMNSVDLFFTDKGWGVFEYCNQFGTMAFDPSESIRYHQDLIVSLYKNKFRSQSV